MKFKQNTLKETNEVDNDLYEIENWISFKDHEILDEEGVIITEEIFDQRMIKYKQIKSEIERKEFQGCNFVDFFYI